MNKRDAMNQIRQFGSKFDRLRNAAGGGGGGRNAPKRPKAAPNPASRKSNVFNEQVRYAWHGALQDLKSTPLATFLTVMVIAISLTLPSVFTMLNHLRLHCHTFASYAHFYTPPVCPPFQTALTSCFSINFYI